MSMSIKTSQVCRGRVSMQKTFFQVVKTTSRGKIDEEGKEMRKRKIFKVNTGSSPQSDAAALTRFRHTFPRALLFYCCRTNNKIKVVKEKQRRGEKASAREHSRDDDESKP